MAKRTSDEPSKQRRAERECQHRSNASKARERSFEGTKSGTGRATSDDEETDEKASTQYAVYGENHDRASDVKRSSAEF